MSGHRKFDDLLAEVMTRPGAGEAREAAIRDDREFGLRR